ncbi:hypothetical protein [Paraburkholderia jirisanensis]
MWVELPEDVSAEAVFEESLRKGVFVAPGFIFSNSVRSGRYLRINTGWPASAQLEAAVGIVAAAARRSVKRIKDE